MKKVKIITITAIIYIGLILGNTQVFAASKGTTINDTTRMREKASTSSATVTLISINQEVEILSEDGDWYKVKYTANGKKYTGYIRNDMLKTDKKEKKEQDKVNEDESEEKENEQTVENNVQQIEVKEGNTAVLKNEIEIKILPLINSNTTGNIEKKSDIIISEILGNWVYVETEEQSGWVINSKLQGILTSEVQENKTETKKEEDKKEENKTETKKEENKPTETIKSKEHKMYVSSQTVNLRKEANSNSAILKQLSKNAQVTIIENVNSIWSKVKVDGLTGYISSVYLSENKAGVTSRGSETSREENTQETKEEVETKKTSKITNTDNSQKTETTQKEESKTDKKETKTSSKITGNDIVTYAKKYLGYNYVSGAASPSTGFDCSGLTSYVYKQNGYAINRTSAAQASNGKKVSKSNLKAGDLVFFSQGSKKIGHVGIYIGGGNFIHSANPKKGVVITSLSNSYYLKNYVTARRIIY